MGKERLRITALLHGQDSPGIVAHVARWIFERGGNILHADQHRDSEKGIFFQRVVWVHAAALDGDEDESRAQEEADAFSAFARNGLQMHVQTALSTRRPRVVLMVSKLLHCFHDLVLRFRSGELPGELVGVISNHTEVEADTRAYGLPLYHVEVTKANKAEAEARQCALVHELGGEVVVLARYMQILSGSMLEELGCPAINIHHSFLPAFKGGRPYHQAHERGVKLIGATAHYVTEELDQGPIIAQAVTPINHRHGVPDLIRRGRDLEKTVLASAVRCHLDHRVLAYDNKTVVFD